MKKIVSLLLCVLLIAGSLPVAVYAGTDDLCLDIVTDSHYSYEYSTSTITKSTEDNPFGHTTGNGKLLAESGAMLKKFLTNAMNDESDFIIFTGDISDDGSTANQLAVKAMLEDFEAKSGKTVLCMPGNHETYNSIDYTPAVKDYADQFKLMYANLGYDKADATDPDSASYTADLTGNYRIIFIDTNNFNDKLYNWVETQVTKARTDGKVLISATHYNLIAHYSFQKLASGITVVSSETSLADKFIEWGIRFNLSGHTHELDIASYSNDNGTLYDIVSGSLTTYPACYRTMKFTASTVEINTEYIKKIDYSDVPSGLCATAEKLIKSDVNLYARKAFLAGSNKRINSLMTSSFISSLLGLTKSEDGEIIELLNQVVPKIKEAMNLPLYGEENSLSVISEKYGYEIPESEYNTALEVFCEAYARHCAGDENSPSYSDFGHLAVNVLGGCLSYALETVSAAQYKTLITFLLAKVDLGIDLPDSIVNLISNSLTKSESIRYLVQYIATPVIDNFLDDQDTADAQLKVANYGTSQENENLFAKIKTLYNNLLTYLNMLLGIISELFIKK